jgi:hypothetical protein
MLAIERLTRARLNKLRKSRRLVNSCETSHQISCGSAMAREDGVADILRTQRTW